MMIELVGIVLAASLGTGGVSAIVGRWLMARAEEKKRLDERELVQIEHEHIKEISEAERLAGRVDALENQVDRLRAELIESERDCHAKLIESERHCEQRLQEATAQLRRQVARAIASGSLAELSEPEAF
jgi:hypothetical protein